MTVTPSLCMPPYLYTLCFSSLIELDEGIEALDAAIEFKNDTIASQQQQLQINETLTAEKFLAENERNLLKARLAALAPDESVMLLSKYFVKVVEVN